MSEQLLVSSTADPEHDDQEKQPGRREVLDLTALRDLRESRTDQARTTMGRRSCTAAPERSPPRVPRLRPHPRSDDAGRRAAALERVRLAADRPRPRSDPRRGARACARPDRHPRPHPVGDTGGTGDVPGVPMAAWTELSAAAPTLRGQVIRRRMRQRSGLAANALPTAAGWAIAPIDHGGMGLHRIALHHSTPTTRPRAPSRPWPDSSSEAPCGRSPPTTAAPATTPSSRPGWPPPPTPASVFPSHREHGHATNGLLTLPRTTASLRSPYPETVTHRGHDYMRAPLAGGRNFARMA